MCVRPLQGVLEPGSGSGSTPQMLGPCSGAPAKYLEVGRCTGGLCTQDSLAGFTGVQQGKGWEDISQCCSGETEDITRIQGEEEMEEGNPCAIHFRSESPAGASGTGGPPGSRRGGIGSPPGFSRQEALPFCLLPRKAHPWRLSA